MRRDLLLAGVGGQGLLSLAAVIGDAALHTELHVKQAEVHGMAQRGGAVQSHLRISNEPIHSDLVEEGTADLILSLEPMEALRYLPFLNDDGAVITATATVAHTASYPDAEAILAALRCAARTVAVDAAALALRAGSPRCANMVLAGASAPLIGLEPAALEASITRLFSDKGPRIVEVNLKGFRFGQEAARALLDDTGIRPPHSAG
jgi:indolepyruvate ferredoxin oxidoreductase beta subunit